MTLHIKVLQGHFTHKLPSVTCEH